MTFYHLRDSRTIGFPKNLSRISVTSLMNHSTFKRRIVNVIGVRVSRVVSRVIKRPVEFYEAARLPGTRIVVSAGVVYFRRER